MRLIKEEKQGKRNKWTIYSYQDKHWMREMQIYHLEDIYLEKIMREMEIECIIVEIASQSIAWLERMEWQKQMIINPYSWKRLASTWYCCPHEWQDEVAITLESQLKEEIEDIDSFLTHFYNVASLQEAYEIYDKWQGERLLCHQLGNKVIDFFQSYEEEVFNYFRYLDIGKIIYK